MAQVFSIFPRLLLAAIGALPLFALTVVLLATWQDPALFGDVGWLRAASTLVLLEILLLLDCINFVTKLNDLVPPARELGTKPAMILLIQPVNLPPQVANGQLPPLEELE